MREAAIGIAAPGGLPGHVGQEPGTQVPVAGLLGARQPEGEHAACVVMGVSIEGHKAADPAQVTDRAEELRPERFRAFGFSSPADQRSCVVTASRTPVSRRASCKRTR